MKSTRGRAEPRKPRTEARTNPRVRVANTAALDLYMNCLIRQAKASNGDFDRGKSEQLKTKRIERSRKITALSECTGQRLWTTLSGRDQEIEKQSL